MDFIKCKGYFNELATDDFYVCASLVDYVAIEERQNEYALNIYGLDKGFLGTVYRYDAYDDLADVMDKLIQYLSAINNNAPFNAWDK